MSKDTLPPVSASIISVTRQIFAARAATATRPAKPTSLKLAVRIAVPDVGEVTCWIGFSEKQITSGITHGMLAAIGITPEQLRTVEDLTRLAADNVVLVRFEEPSAEAGPLGKWDICTAAPLALFAAGLPAGL